MSDTRTAPRPTSYDETTDVRLRYGMQVGDLERLADLTQGTVLPLSARRLERLVLADPSLLDAAVIIAERDEVPVGYVHVTRDGATAHVVSGAVAAGERRQGIGTRLLEAALAHARRHHCERLRISGYPRGYAAPGVDEAADPATAAFLRARGAVAITSALAMQRRLDGLEARTRPRGIAIAPCAPEMLPDVLGAVRDELSADWARDLHAHVMSGGGLARILLARDETDGSLLGVAAWGVIDADDERFGPIGVLPHGRGRGAGGALLDASLAAMARDGVERAHFLWTGPGSPAHRMYLSRGFHPLATTTLFEIQVPMGAPGRTGS